ncbi:hypothetical protein JVU11DRAFT_5775 [Chiua virens]|nr:hypothetical protein JVU11DRAFT_5775 [Chiua virens]
MESNAFSSFSFKSQVHNGAGATGKEMALSMAGVYILASLISGVSAALILASGPGHAEARSLEGPAHHAKRGSSTYEDCRAGSCVYLNSLEDFCLWAPSLPVLSTNGNTEVTEGARGANLIPDGTISGARLVKTPAYIQITGRSSKINVPAGGVASVSGEGNSVHSLVFTSVYGQFERIDHWTSFVSQERFCFRACKSSAAASTTCPPIHDISECLNDALGNYNGMMLEDYVEGATEAPSILHQEALAASSHHYGSPPSGYMPLDDAGSARITRVRRAVPSGSTPSTPVSSFSLSQSPSPEQTAPLASSTVTMPTATATTITFPSLPTSNATASMNSTMQASTILPNSSTSISSFHNHTQTRSLQHSRTLTYSHNHTSSTSIFVSSWSLNSSFHPSWFSSTAYSFSQPSPMASSLPTIPTNSSSAILTSLVTSTSSLITIFAPSPEFTSTSTVTPSPFSSYASPSSSYSQLFSSQSFSSYDSSASSVAQSTPSPTPSSSSFGFSSQTLPSYESSAPSSATPTSSPAAPSTSSSQTSDVLTFTSHQSPSSTPASSTPASSSSPSSTSPAVPSATSNSQTQVGSQCPPPSRRANAAVPLTPLMCTILMVVVSSLVSVWFV